MRLVSTSEVRVSTAAATRCISPSGFKGPTTIRSAGWPAAPVLAPGSGCFLAGFRRHERGRWHVEPILAAVRRAILGGTFDPPHVAHLYAGEVAFRGLDLDVVTFMPAGSPWQKAGREVTTAEDRWRMTELSVANVDYFEADDREVRRAGWTYTIETLEGFPESDELTLVLGADAARRLRTWHRADDVLARARIAVAPRPGVHRDEVDAVLAKYDAVWLDMPELQISGTALRAVARAGGSLRFLVVDAAWRYIVEHQLYA